MRGKPTHIFTEMPHKHRRLHALRGPDLRLVLLNVQLSVLVGCGYCFETSSLTHPTIALQLHKRASPSLTFPLTLGVTKAFGVRQQLPLIGHDYKDAVPYPRMHLCAFRPQPRQGVTTREDIDGSEFREVELRLEKNAKIIKNNSNDNSSNEEQP